MRSSFVPTLLYHCKSNVPETGFVQCWFPGAHTDVGGGYERAYRDISDISLMWMVDMCSDALEFRDDLAESLKRPSSKPVDPLDLPSPNPDAPVDNGWGFSKINDEYHTIKFIAGGATTRTPGQYFLGESQPGSEYETNEFIHSSVRMRLLHKDGYKPDALKGFKLSKDHDGWKWTRKFKVRGQEKEIVLREWQPPYYDHSKEWCLLKPDELERLKNDENFKQFTDRESEKGWFSWLSY